MVRTKVLGVKKSTGKPSKDDAIVVRTPKAKVADSPAGKKATEVKTQRPKRKTTVPTKRELHRRHMFEKKRARLIVKEQKRASSTTACSKNGIRRLIKEALLKVANERQIGDEPAVMPHIQKKAVGILHEVLEEFAVTRFNKASFVLEFAKKNTCTPEVMNTLAYVKMAEDKRPVYELPEGEASAARPHPDQAGAAAEEEEEEEASFTESGSGSESESESGNV